MNILIIEDEPEARQIINTQFELSETGWRWELAKDYYEAEAKANVIQFDLVIADIYMDGKSGVDFCKKYKLEFPDVRIIIITADSEVTKIDGLRVDDIVHKPYNADALMRKVRMYDKSNMCLQHTITLEKVQQKLDLIVSNDTNFKIKINEVLEMTASTNKGVYGYKDENGKFVKGIVQENSMMKYQIAGIIAFLSTLGVSLISVVIIYGPKLMALVK